MPDEFEPREYQREFVDALLSSKIQRIERPRRSWFYDQYYQNFEPPVRPKPDIIIIMDEWTDVPDGWDIGIDLAHGKDRSIEQIILGDWTLEENDTKHK
jgi:hypothetical protein